MSTVIEPTAQDALQATLQPLSATIQPLKPRRSNKAPAVKAAVLIQRANGAAKREIARDLGISRPTVDVIIKEANLDQSLAAGTISCAGLIPKAVNALDKQLSKGDGELGRKFLNDMGVIGQGAKPGMPEQIQLNQAINIMFKPAQPVSVSQAIEVEHGHEPTSDPLGGSEAPRK